MTRLLHVNVWLLLATLSCKSSAVEPLRIAAAADVAAVLEARLKPRWTQGPIEIIAGSSGLLAKQIQEGAPYDVFLSADQETVDQLLASGSCKKDTKVQYAQGALALVVPEGKELPLTLADLENERFQKIAIANPKHAPYGRAALAVLEKNVNAGVLAQRLVFGENVSQALQLVRSGNADAAVIARSLVKGPSLLIEPSGHFPLKQTGVSCAREAHVKDAEQFLKLLMSADVQKDLESAGFLAPERRAE